MRGPRILRLLRFKIVYFDASVQSRWFANGCGKIPVQRTPASRTCIEIYCFLRSERNLENNDYVDTWWVSIRSSGNTRVKDKIWMLKAGHAGVLVTLFYKKRARSKLICACAPFAHAVCKTATSRMQNTHKKVSFTNPVKNTYFWYKCEKVILSSCKHLRPNKARAKRVSNTIFWQDAWDV